MNVRGGDTHVLGGPSSFPSPSGCRNAQCENSIPAERYGHIATADVPGKSYDASYGLTASWKEPTPSVRAAAADQASETRGARVKDAHRMVGCEIANAPRSISMRVELELTRPTTSEATHTRPQTVDHSMHAQYHAPVDSACSRESLTCLSRSVPAKLLQPYGSF